MPELTVHQATDVEPSVNTIRFVGGDSGYLEDREAWDLSEVLHDNLPWMTRRYLILNLLKLEIVHRELRWEDTNKQEFLETNKYIHRALDILEPNL